MAYEEFFYTRYAVFIKQMAEMQIIIKTKLAIKQLFLSLNSILYI